jgi:hypothetical protein
MDKLGPPHTPPSHVTPPHLHGSCGRSNQSPFVLIYCRITLLAQTFLHDVSGVIECFHDVSLDHHALQFY